MQMAPLGNVEIWTFTNVAPNSDFSCCAGRFEAAEPFEFRPRAHSAIFLKNKLAIFYEKTCINSNSPVEAVGSVYFRKLTKYLFVPWALLCLFLKLSTGP